MLIRRLRVLLIPFILLLAAALPACESGDTATAPATAPAPQPTMTVPRRRQHPARRWRAYPASSTPQTWVGRARSKA